MEGAINDYPKYCGVPIVLDRKIQISDLESRFLQRNIIYKAIAHLFARKLQY